MPYNYNRKNNEEANLLERTRLHLDIKAGKSEAFEHLAEKYRRQFEAKYNWGFSNEEKEELFSDAMVGFYTGIENNTFQLGTNHYGFLRLVYLRSAIKLLKKNKRMHFTDLDNLERASRIECYDNDSELNYDNLNEEQIDNLENELAAGVEGVDLVNLDEPVAIEEEQEATRKIRTRATIQPAYTPEEEAQGIEILNALNDCINVLGEPNKADKQFIARHLFDIDIEGRSVLKREELMKHFDLDYNNSTENQNFRKKVSNVEISIRKCLISKGFGRTLKKDKVLEKIDTKQIKTHEMPLFEALLSDLIAKKSINIEWYSIEYSHLQPFNSVFNRVWKVVLDAARKSI